MIRQIINFLREKLSIEKVSMKDKMMCILNNKRGRRVIK